MIKSIKGEEIQREMFNALAAGDTNLIPDETRFVFKTGREPNLLYIASKYNLKDYSAIDIGTSFNIIVYNIFESN